MSHEHLRPHLHALAAFLETLELSNQDTLKLLIVTAASTLVVGTARGAQRDLAIDWAIDMLRTASTAEEPVEH